MKNKFLVCKTAFAMLIFLSGICFGQNVDELRSLFDEVHKKGDFNGSVAILKNNEVIFSDSFGYSDFETKAEFTENTIFEFASVGKRFTAVAIGILAQENKLKFTDKVSKYIPQFPYKQITIKNLLQHTSGLPDYMIYFNANWDKNKRIYNQDVLDYLANEKPDLLFNPGEKWKYSNTGYIVLASIVEKASGYSFADFLEREIFEPVGMSSSLVYRQKWTKNLSIKNYAYGHVLNQESKKIIPVNKYLEPRTVYKYSMRPIDGDGNVIGAISDLVKFDIAMNQNKLLRADIQQKFTEPTVLNDKSKYNHGFAWFLSEDRNEINHTGSVPGYQSFYKKYLKEKVTVIYVKNVATYNWAWLGKLDSIIKNSEKAQN